jgi:hypothetical protein
MAIVYLFAGVRSKLVGRSSGSTYQTRHHLDGADLFHRNTILSLFVLKARTTAALAG